MSASFQNPEQQKIHNYGFKPLLYPAITATTEKGWREGRIEWQKGVGLSGESGGASRVE